MRKGVLSVFETKKSFVRFTYQGGRWSPSRIPSGLTLVSRRRELLISAVKHQIGVLDARPRNSVVEANQVLEVPTTNIKLLLCGKGFFRLYIRRLVICAVAFFAAALLVLCILCESQFIFYGLHGL